MVLGHQYFIVRRNSKGAFPCAWFCGWLAVWLSCSFRSHELPFVYFHVNS